MGAEIINAKGMRWTQAALLQRVSHTYLPKDPRHFSLQGMNPKLRWHVSPKVAKMQGYKNPGFLTLALVLSPLGYSRQKFKFVVIYEPYCT